MGNLREQAGVWVRDDRETGSTWGAFAGRAVSERLEGARLETIPGTQAFWFAWKQIDPDTRLWTPIRAKGAAE